MTFIKLPFVIKIVVLSFLEWPFYTGLTVLKNVKVYCLHFVSFQFTFEHILL